MEKKRYSFHVNGLPVEAEYDEKNIEQIFIPLLAELNRRFLQKGSRLIVYLAAPPGTGKTTLVQFLEHLSGSIRGMAGVQAIGLDGFHYSQDYLDSHEIKKDGKLVLMKDIKGSPETFDIEKVRRSIHALRRSDVKWPIYDRTLHDVVPDALLVTKDIILIEGNWILLDEDGWRELICDSDFSIFITAEERMLKERLIARKITGGLTARQAEDFYERSDGKNIRRALSSRLKPDLLLHLQENGEYTVEGDWNGEKL